MFWNFQMNSYDVHRSILNWKWYPENFQKPARNIKWIQVLEREATFKNNNNKNKHKSDNPLTKHFTHIIFPLKTLICQWLKQTR